MSGFIAKRALKNVRISELLRQAVATSPRLLPGALLPLLLLWLPALLIIGAVVTLIESDAIVAPALGGLVGYSMLIAPVLAAGLVGPALRIGAGGRVRAGEVLKAALPGAGVIVVALVAGLATSAAFAACVLPAYFVGSLWFVAGPVARVEGGGLGSVLSRTAQLTAGSRWTFVGVMFLIGFLEGFLFRLALFFDALGDSATTLVVACLMILPTTLLRAVASCAAYNELRVAQEDLEIDAVAKQLGGVQTEQDDLALSERDIAALQRRRGVIAWLSGSAAQESDADPMASVRDMERVIGRRKLRLRVLSAVVVAAVVLGTTAAVAMGVYNRVAENRRIDAMERSVREAEGASDGLRNGSVSREVAGHVLGARNARRREVLGRLMAIHADSFYGAGFSEAFAALGRDDSDDELLSALHIPLEAAGCAEGLATAKSDPKNPAKTFAKHCPEGEAAPLHLSRFRSATPLGRAVFAELLELRARERRIESDPLHEIAVRLLLPEP